jgi:hypothetical protein
VNEPKNVREDFGIVWLLLEANQFNVNDIEILVCLSKKFPKKVVHEQAQCQTNAVQRRRRYLVGTTPRRTAIFGP